MHRKDIEFAPAEQGSRTAESTCFAFPRWLRKVSKKGPENSQDRGMAASKSSANIGITFHIWVKIGIDFYTGTKLGIGFIASKESARLVFQDSTCLVSRDGTCLVSRESTCLVWGAKPPPTRIKAALQRGRRF